MEILLKHLMFRIDCINNLIVLKMKRIALLIIIICSCLSIFSQATDIVVDCQTPGWLSSKINYGDQQTVRNLKVTGYINEEDLKFIGSLTQMNLKGVVDLGDVNIVGGKWNGAFDTLTKSWSSDYNYHLQKLILPKMLTYYLEHQGTSETEVDTLVFDINTSKIEGYDSAHRNYRTDTERTFKRRIGHLIIGEKVDSVLNVGNAQTVHFPQSLKYLENYSCNGRKDFSKWNIREFPNLEYLGFCAFTYDSPGTGQSYFSNNGTLPDSVFLPKIKSFCMSSFDYKEGMHVFFGDKLSQITDDDNVGWTYKFHSKIENVSFHFKTMTPPSNGMYYCSSTCRIYVPKGAKSAYEADGNFNKFEIIEESNTYSLDITSIGKGTATYSSSTIRENTQTFTVNEGTSATITFTPDTGYRIKSVKLNGSDVTSSVANSQYTVSNIKSDNTLTVEFEAIPPTTYSFTIKATGNGTATYNDTSVRGKSSSFTVNEGTSAIVKFTPDDGYRIASVKLNDTDVTSSVSNNQYTISNITADLILTVTFETITHTLSITASGNGSVTYNSTAVREKTQEFTVNEGKSATITFAPDAGYRIASVKLNDTDVTSNVADNKYTISNITANTTLAVTFEEIPPTTYTLSITASGNGSTTYSSTAVRGKTQTFTVTEGTSATITFTPDTGYRIASVKLNDTDVTSSVVNSQYTISNIKSDNTLAVEFEAIPPTTYTLSITATGNGSATYNDTAVRGKTTSFTVNEGTSATITFAPDAGYRIASVKLNENDVSSSIANNEYTIKNISANTTFAVAFEAIPPTTYSFTIKATGNGTATYNDTSIRDKSSSFTVNEGTSATITFAPDAGYRIASVMLNGTNVTASVANNIYTISSITANTTLAVTFEVIPPTTYTLSISTSGNGYVAYDGNTIRSKTLSFSLVEGTNAILKFSADDGNRLKSVKVDGQDVTSTIVNDQYTISSISANTSVEVAFEAIPDYTLNIVASGNGSAIYNGTTIKNQSQNFTLREGTSATITFTPDAGYRIASVKLNNTDVTSQVSDGKITINNITQDTNVEVTFEEIPPTTYSLTITATGNGVVTYEGQSIRGGTSTFTVVEGSYATVQISADDGYRLKRVMLGSKDVTTDAANGQYTTTKIMANTTLAVEFEAIPTFSLVIKSSAFGSVKYGDVTITNQTETFTVREGTSAVLTFVPDGNGRLRQVTLNGGDITGELKNGQYTISDIRADQSVEAEYVEDITKVTNAGVAYTVTSYDEGTVIVAAGNYGQVLTVPATFTAKGKTWTVTGIDSDALADATELAAIIWEPEVAFTAQVSNPNLLLYVKSAQYAPSEIQNVVVNDQAENIILTEAASGNNFYCPKAFTARKISYGHNYSMISGYSACQGWETLVLPFDVSMVINAKGTELMPYSTWEYGNNLRPFWLYQLTENGWQASNAIKANVPYIIGMPNNEMYESSYNQTGSIQFIGNNVQVMTSDEMTTGRNGNKRFVANYQNHAASTAVYALNVSNEWCQNTAAEKEGSAFIRSLRNVHPFEAYMTVEGSNAVALIPIFDNATDVRWLMEEVRGTMAEDAWYDLQGRKLQGEPKQNGIYIYKGKKVKK